MRELLQNPEVVRLLSLGKDDLLFAIWETCYVTVIATFFAYVIGLPLGVLMVAGEEGGVRPLPRPVMSALNVIINILRSVPFLILMVLVIPLSRVILGTSIGTVATIIPLIVAAFPFVARLVEASIREVDKGVVEAAQSMGCSPLQIIAKVMIPESRPSLRLYHCVYHHPQLRRHGRRHRRRRTGLHGAESGLPAPHEHHPLGLGGGAGHPGADLPVHRHLPGGPVRPPDRPRRKEASAQRGWTGYTKGTQDSRHYVSKIPT